MQLGEEGRGCLAGSFSLFLVSASAAFMVLGPAKAPPTYLLWATFACIPLMLGAGFIVMYGKLRGMIQIPWKPFREMPRKGRMLCKWASACFFVGLGGSIGSCFAMLFRAAVGPGSPVP